MDGELVMTTSGSSGIDNKNTEVISINYAISDEKNSVITVTDFLKR
jgi:hypothetical protein